MTYELIYAYTAHYEAHQHPSDAYRSQFEGSDVNDAVTWSISALRSQRNSSRDRIVDVDAPEGCVRAWRIVNYRGLEEWRGWLVREGAFERGMIPGRDRPLPIRNVPHLELAAVYSGDRLRFWGGD